MTEKEKNEEISKNFANELNCHPLHAFNGCPVVDPFEQIIEKLNEINANLTIVIDYLWDIKRKE